MHSIHLLLDETVMMLNAIMTLCHDDWHHQLLSDMLAQSQDHIFYERAESKIVCSPSMYLEEK